MEMIKGRGESKRLRELRRELLPTKVDYVRTRRTAEVTGEPLTHTLFLKPRKKTWVS